jgi:hypothetical protein
MLFGSYAKIAIEYSFKNENEILLWLNNSPIWFSGNVNNPKPIEIPSIYPFVTNMANYWYDIFTSKKEIDANLDSIHNIATWINDITLPDIYISWNTEKYKFYINNIPIPYFNLRDTFTNFGKYIINIIKDMPEHYDIVQAWKRKTMKDIGPFKI